MLPCLQYGLMSAPAWPKPKAPAMELRVEDGQKHLQQGLLQNAVQDGWNSQVALATSWLWYCYSPHRLWLIRAREHLLADGSQQLVELGAKLVKGFPIHSWRSTIALHSLIRLQQVRRAHCLLEDAISGLKRKGLQ
jgi:hypothetical protein